MAVLWSEDRAWSLTASSCVALGKSQNARTVAAGLVAVTTPKTEVWQGDFMNIQGLRLRCNCGALF